MEITEERVIIESIIKRATVCRIAMIDGDRPYIVPVNFGYRDGALYFHSSPAGTKMSALQKNNAVCFEFDVDTELMEAEQACRWGIKYRSVIGFGKAFLVEEPEKKRRALDLLMAQYSDRTYDYPEAMLDGVAIVRVEIERMTAKVSGY